jgi:hypothetical protein
MNILCKFLVATLCATVVSSGVVTINNMVPRVDVNGNIIDAHDGSVQKFTIGNSSLYCILIKIRSKMSFLQRSLINYIYACHVIWIM